MMFFKKKEEPKKEEGGDWLEDYVKRCEERKAAARARIISRTEEGSITRQISDRLDRLAPEDIPAIALLGYLGIKNKDKIVNFVETIQTTITQNAENRHKILKNELERDKLREEINAMRIANASSGIITNLLDKIVVALNFEKITYEQAWLLRTAIAKDSTPEFRAGMYEEELAKMKQETARMQAETVRKQHEAEQEKHKTRVMEAKANETVNEIEAGDIIKPGRR